MKRIANGYDIPCIVTVHGICNLVRQFDSNLTDGMAAEDIHGVLKRNSHIVGVSSEVVDHCRSSGIGSVSHIHGGVDMDFFQPDPAAVRRDFLYVGKANRHKGIREVCTALLQGTGHRTDRVHLAGRGITREAFEACGFFLDMPERARLGQFIEAGEVVLWGELEPTDLRKLYQSARALLLPSLTEGFPIAILEALACATPVIASDVGSVSDVVKSGVNGHLIAAGDSATLARLIDKSGHAALHALEPRCRPSAAQFDSEHSAGKYLQLFEFLMHGNARHDRLAGGLAGQASD